MLYMKLQESLSLLLTERNASVVWLPLPQTRFQSKTFSAKLFRLQELKMSWVEILAIQKLQHRHLWGCKLVLSRISKPFRNACASLANKLLRTQDLLGNGNFAANAG